MLLPIAGLRVPNKAVANSESATKRAQSQWNAINNQCSDDVGSPNTDSNENSDTEACNDSTEFIKKCFTLV